MTTTTPLGRLDDDVLAVLRRATSVPTLAYAGTPTRLAGGFWAELVAFRLHEAPPELRGELVARVMPDAHTAAKETAIQAEVAAQGYPTPRVHLAGGPDDGLGRAFMVMDRVDGRPLLDGLGGAGAIAALPRLARRLPETLASAMAALHRLDPEPIRRRVAAGRGGGIGETELIVSLRETAARCARPDLVAVAEWLLAHPPHPTTEVVCHGDLHPFNLLVDDDGRVTVLDWSAGRVAPALHDVAFTGLLLAEPPVLVPRGLRPGVRAAGRALARRFRRAYERHAQIEIDADALQWHEGVICLRALVEVAGWVVSGDVDARGAHPWLISGPALAARVGRLTGIDVTPR